MSSTSQHTPGPWQAIISGVTRAISTTNGAPKQATICRLFTECASFAPGEPEANARLIAAAPELLAALESALASIEGQAELLRHCGAAYGIGATLAQSRAAIARATGGNAS